MAKVRNRRKGSRKTSSYPARFWTREWQGAGTVTNVSDGGLFMSTWPPVEQGGTVLFEVETENGPYAAAALVTRIAGVEQDEQSGMGLRLLSWPDAVGVPEVRERISTPLDLDHSFGWTWRIW